MTEFGTTSSFNTERCEAFNKDMRMYNIHSNKKASSHDINCNEVCKIEQLRLIASEGTLGRCGEGLYHLTCKPEIRKLIFGNSYPDDGSGEDHISGSEILRKNIKLMCPLSVIPLTSITSEETNLAEIQATGHTCEMAGITTDAQVSVHRAVLAGNGSLINCGCFLAYYSSIRKIEYGHLEGCFEEAGNSHCIIRQFERLECGGNPVYNELDCPLLELSEHYKIIPSSAAIAPVSILHECDDDCKFVAGTKRTVEREEFVNKGLLIYVHNYRNF